MSWKKRSEEANGLIVRSGASQVHPKGPGPVSSKLDTGGLTGGIKTTRKKWEGKNLRNGDLGYWWQRLLPTYLTRVVV